MQHQLMQLQQYQQQAQMLAMQRQQMEMQLTEIDNALEELKKVKAKSVFKSVGPLLVKTDISEAKKGMEEQRETLDVRLKSMEKQEDRLKSKLKELSEKISSALPSTGFPKAG